MAQVKPKSPAAKVPAKPEDLWHEEGRIAVLRQHKTANPAGLLAMGPRKAPVVPCI
jgi:hypothetical protein